MKIELLEEVGSTNDYIKRYLSGVEDVVVCAKRQTSGRGTKGRSFLSEEGGVYLSALTYYDNLPACEAFKIMTHAAVAVCRTAKEFGVEPEIKWPNDVLVNGKKLCGILIENILTGGCIKASVVGIGLNVVNELSNLKGIAVSLSELTNKSMRAEDVRDRLIENYQKTSAFAEYLSYVRFLGKAVRIIEGEKESLATARRILPDGRLEIEQDGIVRALSAAEISLRL